MLGYSIVMEALSCPIRQITSSYLTRLPTYTPTSSVRTNNAIRFSKNAMLSLFRADGTAFACHAESGKRTADIRLSTRGWGMRGLSSPGTSTAPSLETTTIHFSIWRHAPDLNRACSVAAFFVIPSTRYGTM